MCKYTGLIYVYMEFIYVDFNFIAAVKWLKY